MKNNQRKSKMRRCTFVHLSKVDGFRSGSGSLLPAPLQDDVSGLAVVIEKGPAPSVEWSNDNPYARIFRTKKEIGGGLVMDHKAINAGRRREWYFGSLMRSRSIWARGNRRRIRWADAGDKIPEGVIRGNVVPIVSDGRSADQGGGNGCGDNGFQHGLNLVTAARVRNCGRWENVSLVH